jgi:hypothetical protein
VNVGALIGRFRLRSGPQAALLPPGMGQQIASVFRACLLRNSADIVLKGQPPAIESLDGYLFDCRAMVPDVKLLVSCIHKASDPLTCQRSRDVVRFVIDADASIGLHRPGKGLLVHPLQPLVRIDCLGHPGQRRELRIGHTRRLVATGTRLIGTFLIVVLEKALGDLANLLSCLWQMHPQTFLRERAMKPLDIGIQIGTMRRDEHSVAPQHTTGSAPAPRGNPARSN